MAILFEPGRATSAKWPDHAIVMQIQVSAAGAEDQPPARSMLWAVEEAMHRSLIASRWLCATSLLAIVLILARPETADAIDCGPATRDGKTDQCQTRSEPLKKSKTALIEFATSPFPYDGMVPEKDTAFLDVKSGARRGHRTPRGRVLWEDITYRERRVLLHIPKGFDFHRPAVMVIFFHGHGATLRRDVRDRQLVPAQISASGINAVLVAPQFAFNASDSSAGKFWQPGAFREFVVETGNKLTALHGNPLAAEAFANMPIVIVAYSGGYLATAWCLEVGGIDHRLRGVVLLDALYGELEKFANWITNNQTSFFVSAYTESTQRKNLALEAMLAEQNIAFEKGFRPKTWKQGVTFLSTNEEVKHEDFVTQAWVDYPVKDLLRRLDEYRR